LFFTTQTWPVHRETDSGDEKFITPINKMHNPILGYAPPPERFYFKGLDAPCTSFGNFPIVSNMTFSTSFFWTLLDSSETFRASKPYKK